MEMLSIFPHLNAILNGTSGIFLILGFYFIMKRQISRHRFCMLTASIISTLFLISYIAHHAIRTYYFGLGPTKFIAEGIIRPIYFTILLSHTILAVLVAPMVIVTLWRALHGRFDAHRKIARLTFPIWLYVSITGVAVYLILYQFYPPQ